MSEQQGRVSREVRGSLFLIGLDRAAKRNAFDSHMIHDLSLALTEYEDDPSLRCAVIFAHGEHFTAGLDLVELQPKLTAGVFDFPASQINPWGTSSRPRTKPVVVAAQGFCFTAGIELMLNAANLNFIAFWRYGSAQQLATGPMFVLFSIGVAAAEAAIGLAILVVYFRNRGTIAVEDINEMKG